MASMRCPKPQRVPAQELLYKEKAKVTQSVEGYPNEKY